HPSHGTAPAEPVSDGSTQPRRTPHSSGSVSDASTPARRTPPSSGSVSDASTQPRGAQRSRALPRPVDDEPRDLSAPSRGAQRSRVVPPAPAPDLGADASHVASK